MSDPENRTETGGRDAQGRILPGVSGNPAGRPKKTDDERAGEAWLRERTLGAAQTLTELQGPEHEPKIRLGAAIAHLKVTLGVLERIGDPEGKALSAHSGLTLEQLQANARYQLEREAERVKTESLQPALPVK